MTHLTPEELIDAVEGRGLFTHHSLGEGGAADRQAHLATCEHCQGQVAALSSVLAEAKLASVPEPSPLFWTHFSARVRTAIDDDVPGGTWPSWLRWQVLLPLGATAMIILALMLAVPKPDLSESDFALQESQAPEAPQAPVDSWTMVADLVGELDLETAAEAGVLVAPGLAERAVLELTADEQQALTRLLRTELTRAKS